MNPQIDKDRIENNGESFINKSLEELIASAIAGPDRFELPWHCHGISSMHRALIHRLALRELKQSYGSNHRILWMPVQDPPQPYVTDPSDQSLVWIDASLWANQIAKANIQSDYPADGHLRVRSDSTIRILWCWNQINWQDFLSATPWMATGVVYNLTTLKSWIRRSLRLGKWQAAIGPTSSYLS